MAKLSKAAVTKETFDITWPSVLESVLVALAGMVDTYMVSSLGKAAVSSIGVTNQPKFFMYTAFFATGTVISLLVARRVGEKKRKEVNALFLSGFLFVIVLCLAMSLLNVVFAKPFMTFAGANSETIDYSVKYYRIVMGFSIFNLLSLYINAAQRGSGNTRIAMVTNLTSNAINVVMNYLLINGHFGFPALGVIGAAIATVIGTVVACIMSILSLFNAKSYVQVQYMKAEKISPSMDNIKEMIPAGSTIFLENILTRAGMMITSAMTARIGTAPYAAHIVGMHFMTMGSAFGEGLQSAMIALVGRSIGEKDIEKAKQYTWSGQSLGLLISITVAALVLIFDDKFFGLYFPNDAEMIGYGRIISFFFAFILPIMVAKIVFGGSLRGAGDVRYVMIGSTIAVTLVQPAALYVMQMMMHLGLRAVWGSMLISQATQLIIFYARYLSGKWEKYALADTVK